MKNQIFKILIALIFILNFNFVAISQDYCHGDNFTLQATNYVAGTVQWQYSYDDVNWYDFDNANSLTFYFIPDASMYVRLQIHDTSCIPEYYYAEKQYIELIPQPTVADAGYDQLGIIGTSTVLEANQAEIGIGFWTIEEGQGGSLSDPNIPNATFTGLVGESYTLSWQIFNSCGSTEDFVKISFVSNFICGQNIVDSRDGQTYPTVSIGGKCWLAKNMNIGTMVFGTEQQTNTETIQKYCYANDENNCNIYGGLYQWNMAMQFSTSEGVQGICPEGWHIPTDYEFKQLELALSMPSGEVDIMNSFRGHAQNVGGQMKQGGGSGFEALFAGARNGGGGFMYLQGTGSYDFAYFWSSSHCSEGGECSEGRDENFAIRRCLQGGSQGSGRYDTFNKGYGFSVRCVKNN